MIVQLKYYSSNKFVYRFVNKDHECIESSIHPITPINIRTDILVLRRLGPDLLVSYANF